jgi:hypothetical protein
MSIFNYNPNIPVPLPTPKNDNERDIFDAQIAIENLYVRYIRRESIKYPKGMKGIEFSTTLLICRAEINGATPPEALERVQKFINAVREANKR